MYVRIEFHFDTTLFLCLKMARNHILNYYFDMSLTCITDNSVSLTNWRIITKKKLQSTNIFILVNSVTRNYFAKDNKMHIEVTQTHMSIIITKADIHNLLTFHIFRNLLEFFKLYAFFQNSLSSYLHFGIELTNLGLFLKKSGSSLANFKL